MHEPSPEVTRCALCGEASAEDEARAVVACRRHAPRETWNTAFEVRPPRPDEDGAVRRLATGFWGRVEVHAFGRLFDLLEQENLVADAGGAVAGLVSRHVEGDDGFVVALAVPPLYQGLGVGGALLSAAIGRLRASGARRIRLSTTNDNVLALQFYQRRGFVLDEIRPGAIARLFREQSRPVPVGFAGIAVRDEIRMSLAE